MKIVEERLKRNCESAVTKYSLKSHEKQKSKPRKNGSLEPHVPQNGPPKLQISKEISDGLQIIQADMKNVSSIIEKFGYKCIPVTAAVVQFGKHLKQQKPDLQTLQKTEEKTKWPGVQEVMESYQRYARGKYNSC